MSTHRYGLRSFVHRTLARRLLAGGIIVATLFSMITYFSRYDDIGEAAIVHAINGIEQIRLRVGSIQRQSGVSRLEALQKALDEEPEYRTVSRYGRFVSSRFYTPEGEILAKWTEDGQPDSVRLKNFAPESAMQYPDPGMTWRESTSIEDWPYIHVVIPIVDSSGNLAVYGEGLYALSSETIAAARNEALGAAGYVLLIVLSTSLLLYPIIISLTNRLSRFSEKLLDANLDTIQVLGSAIAKRDSDTDAHNYRVTLYAIHLAEASGLDAESMRGIIKGAFLHDVGKIGISDNILHKPGRLDESEFETMKTHVQQGLEIINRSGWLDDAAGVVGAHHEKFDGNGYPRRLRGEDIPLGARIFAITDVFDALTSRRPYKEPFSFEETMQILEEGRGSHFDPAMLDLFAGLAKGLHQRYGGREDEGLREELNGFLQRYFSADEDLLQQ